ncbi:GtrA family protein [Brucella sp. 6810]|uniref:GtrA family protein n=1 Tax=Brucella sp. 6810 TaxID=2769351 RepID=UPI00165C6669|nr:GtrA family protein [Brucella sp. 6810]QNQ64371.1 GtrA family protein [Brucella sp. 6810]
MFKRFPIFVGGSAIGAVIDYVVTLSASNYINLYPAVALALAMLISGSVVFFFHIRITFQYSTHKIFRQYALFMGWTCVIYFLRATMLQICLYTGLPLAVALILAIGLASVINFVISSVIIFAKSPS